MPADFIADLATLPPVESCVAEAYAHATDALLERVDRSLSSDPGIACLIGGNPLELMYDNHRNHAAFMTMILRLNDYQLLAKTIPWVYRVYRARGFSFEYFPVELSAWKEAIKEMLPEPQAVQISRVYDWMIGSHEGMVSLSLSGEGLDFSPLREPSTMQEVLLSLLLHGDSRGCLKLVQQSVQNEDQLKAFYLDVVSPVMYRIGIMWERNDISVSEEHMASAIVGRISAALYARFASIDVLRGRALVTACPNEFHEVGGRMLADFLELDGWDVTYLGASSPTAEILAMIRKQRPFLMALSVSTIFNLHHARETVRAIRSDREICGTRIMVGGLAFKNGDQAAWREFGADGYAAEADQAAELAGRWWEEHQREAS